MMKKALTVLALTLTVALPALARYIVVLKDGTRYVAKEKWTVKNGKALILLETGQALQLDPALIDVARSEQATKSGFGSNAVVDLTPNLPPAKTAQNQPNLGDIKLRQRPSATNPTAPAPATSPNTPAPITGTGTMLPEVVDKFDRAFENVGIFERKITPTGAHSLRAELTVDTEQRVFNAISAASYLMSHNAGVDGASIEIVELFMKQTTGGSAGRFQMSRADADALTKRTISQQEYFVRKVIY